MFTDKIASGLIKIFSGINKVSTSSDKAEDFTKKYSSTLYVLFICGLVIMFSRLYTQKIYSNRIKVYSELSATEAIYNKRKQEFQIMTRKSNLINEVKNRNIPVVMSDNPPIEL